MKIRRETRVSMMNLISSEILHANSAIEFKDVDDILLCTILFDDFITTGSPGNVEYKFLKDDNDVLRNDCDASGEAVKAIIKNTDGDMIIEASVGDMGSDADILFNKRQWTIGMIITVDNLRLVMPEGV